MDLTEAIEAAHALPHFGWVDPEEAARLRQSLEIAEANEIELRERFAELRGRAQHLLERLDDKASNDHAGSPRACDFADLLAQERLDHRRTTAERDALLRERAEHEVKQADVEWLQKRAAEAFAAADIATRAAEQACAERDRDAAELRDKRTDLLDIRGLLSPNGGERVVPFGLGDAVAPAVEYLISEVRALLRLREAAVAAKAGVDEAKKRLFARLIANASYLDVPFTDVPDQSPWTKVKAAMYALDAAVDALPGDGQDQGGSQARPEDSASQVTEADHG